MMHIILLTDHAFTLDIAIVQPGAGLTASYCVPNGSRAGTYVYAEAGGDGQTVHRLDDYHDPDGDWDMSCVAVTRADAPLQVIFRRVPGWACIIFECCDGFATQNQHMMPGSGDNIVTIYDDGEPIDEVRFWGQWALGRWRWQSGPWPFPKDVEALRARGWLPRMDTMVLGKEPSMPVWTPYTPMHIPHGYPLYVGGGGNPTLFSSVQGYWLCKPDQNDSLAHMLEQAEGLAAYPWFVRDNTTWGVPDIWRTYPTKTKWMTSSSYSSLDIEVTGKPGAYFGSSTVTDENGAQWFLTWQPYCVVDANGYLAATINNNAYPGAAQPYGPLTINNADIHTVSIKANPNFIQGSGMVIDEAHSGSMWPTSWLATGDPYYLEALHAKYVLVWWGGGRSVPRPKLAYSQIRQTAWQLTSLMVSAFTTPEVTPSWILPRDLWQWLWDDEMRLWDQELVHGTSPGATLFHTVGVTAGGAQPGMSYAPWQEDMILQVMSWAAMMRPEYKDRVEWKVQDQIARTNGASGWCQYAPEGYYLVHGPDDRSRWYADWHESWINNQSQKRVPGPPDPTSFTGTSPDYTAQLRAGLALATQAGVVEAQECAVWVNQEMQDVGWGDGWHRLFATVD